MKIQITESRPGEFDLPPVELWTRLMGAFEAALDQAARQIRKAAPVALGPPPARNRKRHPFRGTIDFQGLRIRVETPKGETRSGVDTDGKPWSVVMPAHYGEVAGTEGTDGDPVDVFVGDDAHAPFAYVIHLKDPATGEHDEDKVFLGFATAEDVRECFGRAYNRRDLKLGTVRRMSVGELREWLAQRGQKIEGGVELSKALPRTGGEMRVVEDLAQITVAVYQARARELVAQVEDMLRGR